MPSSYLFFDDCPQKQSWTIMDNHTEFT